VTAKRPFAALACVALACVSGCKQGSTAADAGAVTFTSQELAALATLSPATLPLPGADVTNRFADNPAAAFLGQELFMDPAFSGALLDSDNDGHPGALGTKGDTGKVSCAGCHVPTAGFSDNRSVNHTISLASGWNLRKTPSLLDVGQAKAVMWDGRHDTLYNQPFGPIENPTEMNSSRLYVAEQIYARYRNDYQEIFGQMPDLSVLPQLDSVHTGCDQLAGGSTAPICHGIPGDHAEYDGLTATEQDQVTRVVVNAGKAIGAYERLLSCGQGRFDKFVAGDTTAMTASEQRGAQVFVGKGQCIQCHTGPFLSDQAYHNVGLRPAVVQVGVAVDSGDRGAFIGLALALSDPLNSRGVYSDGDDNRLATPVSSQDGAFRTPTLRCVAGRPSFMHTAQIGSLAGVVTFFNQGGLTGGYPGTSEIAGLGLTAQEQSDLVAFLGTLTGPGPSASLLTSP
jgi:cytochrome c peroxidase